MMYTVTELWRDDGDILINLSHSYSNFEAAEAHLRRLAEQDKKSCEVFEQEWRIYEKEMPWFYRSELDEENWINIEIHEQEVRDKDIRDKDIGDE